MILNPEGLDGIEIYDKCQIYVEVDDDGSMVKYGTGIIVWSE